MRDFSTLWNVNLNIIITNKGSGSENDDNFLSSVDINHSNSTDIELEIKTHPDPTNCAPT